MDPQRMARIDALFQATLDADNDERRALLERAGNDDPDLRAEVERLLELSREELATDIGEHLVGAGARVLSAALHDDEPRAGDRVGPYTLVREIGRGGMSVVFLAERVDGAFEQRVALKFLAGARLSRRSVARFEQERQILAGLSHPNVARLLDGGVDDEGRPYLVMEHVDGRPIDEHCDRARLTVAERIRLIVVAARTVQQAHRNLVIHRDLKPSNLLVDTSGEVKLLDFGIAKLIDPSEVGPALTHTQERAMTPEYASPELVQGRAITTASDVYQLGLLLYEIVTGHRAQAATSGSLSELVRLVCETDPPRPSRVLPRGDDLTDLARLRRTTPSRLRRELDGDFDAVIARALAKEPERRYGSPEEPAADLERLLAGFPVVARRGSTLDRARKLVRRHKGASLAVTVTAVLTLAYAITLTIQARQIIAERDRAEAEAAKAAEVERFVVGLFEVADPSRSRGEQVTARELLEAGAARVDEELASEPEVQARMLSTLGYIHERLGLYDEAVDLLTKALDERREVLGNRHLDTAESLHRLGVMLRRNGRFEDAEELLAEAEAIRREQLAADHPDVAESITQRGFLNYFWGRYEAADAAFREALEIRERIGELEGIANAESGLSMVATALGNLEEAERRQRRVVEIDRELLGDDHPYVSTDLFNLARVLQQQEDFPGAQPLLEEALAISRKAYGDDHPETAVSLSGLANNCQILGDLDRADALFAEAQIILENDFGPDHDRTLSNLGGIARLRRVQGRTDESEKLLVHVIDRFRELFGADHLRVAHGFLALGQTQEAAGRTAAARATYAEALAIADGHSPSLVDRLQRELAALDERVAHGELAADDPTNRAVANRQETP